MTKSVFEWRGEASKSGKDLMRGLVAPIKTLPDQGANNTTKLLHEMRPTRKGNI